ncbi:MULTISPECIES: NUDIX hydrolase [unclassified Flavobacterium]|uniref:NUDIX hydrolase n=1 Tax=unclassified Flavobacterium TaxID=196869 RepID=UPI003F8DA9A6
MDFRKINNLSVECVIFGLDADNLNVLLHKRTLNLYNDNFPIIDDWMLPGQHVYKSNNLAESADSVLKAITKKPLTNKKQFRTYGSNRRVNTDKDILWIRSKGGESRNLTVVYYLALPLEAIAIENNEDLQWFPLKNLPEIGFDHQTIITDAYDDLKSKIMTEPIMFDLVPMKFTLNELQSAFEITLNIELDNRNFRKKAIHKPFIVPLEDKKKIGISKKPSKLYMFSKDIYDKLTEKDNIISTIL